MFWHRTEWNGMELNRVVSAFSWYFCYKFQHRMLVCMCVYVCVVVVTNGIGYYATLFRGTDSTRYAHKISFYTPHCSHNLCFFLRTQWHLRINFVQFGYLRLDLVPFICSIYFHIRAECFVWAINVKYCSAAMVWVRNFFLWCLSYEFFFGSSNEWNMHNKFNGEKNRF